MSVGLTCRSVVRRPSSKDTWVSRKETLMGPLSELGVGVGMIQIFHEPLQDCFEFAMAPYE